MGTVQPEELGDAFIDADAHVDECNETWSYFPQKRADLRPKELLFDQGLPGYLDVPGKDEFKRLWFIDGQVYVRPVRDDVVTGTTVGSRELHDVSARLKDLDELNIGVQVLFPTVLLYEMTRRAEVEVAICESYNRWLGDRCSDNGERLKWVAVLPYRSIPDALNEMRRAKKAGAVGIFKRAFECDERRAGDPYFDPIYQLAEELDLTVCVHISRPYTGTSNSLTKTQLNLFSPGYVQDAFLSILMDGTARRFPTLRFGFIESAAGWAPYALWLAGFSSLNSSERIERGRIPLGDILQDARFYLTCESTEPLDSIIGAIGDKQLCLGTDYVHTDRATVHHAHTAILARDDIPQTSAARITRTNALELYGLA